MITSTDKSSVSLRQLFAGMVGDQLDEQLGEQNSDLPITSITSDSRKAQPGGLFLACDGIRGHGLNYLDRAVNANVAAVAWEPGEDVSAPSLPTNIIGFEVAGLSDQVGDIADRFYRRPSAKLAVTGVTGTNGKTTVARLASSALSLLDGASGYMGTMGYGIGDALEPSALTTPGCIVVHQRLREMLKQGARSVVMEVSSHGLDQGRIDGVRITTAAMTNLSRDHLDYHGSFSNYAKAKARLFLRAGLKTAVINVGDDFGAQLADGNLAAQSIIKVAIANSASPLTEIDLLAELLNADRKGLHIRFSGKFGMSEFVSPLWGRFNVENLTIAAGILIAHGYPLKAVTQVLAKLGAPAGRMQILRSVANPTVIVDFAHTPAALEQALIATRDHGAKKTWCVFGCGGNRDQGKRPLMGAAAQSHADQVILTTDNPRDEDASAIIKDIQIGVTDADKFTVIPDRAEAIATAIRQASPDDSVLIAGKGSEEYQQVGDQQIPFSDANVVKALFGGAS